MKNTWPAVVRKAIGGRTVAGFCRYINSETYRNPYEIVRAWIYGESVPSIKRIPQASELIGVSLDDVAMACYGKTYSALCDVRKEAKRLRGKAAYGRNGKQRYIQQRWNNAVAMMEAYGMPRFPRIIGNDLRGLVRMDRLLLRGYACPSKVGVKVTRELNQSGLSKAAVIRKLAYNKRLAKRNIIIDGRHYTIKGVLRLLNVMMLTLDRLSNEVDDALNRDLREWHIKGFKTLDAWVCSGSDDAVEYRRTMWQARSNHRRSLKKQAGGNGISRDRWIAIMAEWGYSCAYCGRLRKEVRNKLSRSDLEMDHVVPMPIGPDDASNVVPACKRCNTSKSDSDLVAWANKKGITISERVMDVYLRNTPLLFGS